MKTITFIFLLVFSISFSAFSQNLKQDSIHISGIVIDKDSLKPMYGVYCVVNKKYSTLTNKKGHFSLWASKGDTVSFAQIGYLPTYWVVNDTLSQKTYIIGITLSTKSYKLNEIVVVPRIRKEEVKNTLLNPVVNRDLSYAKSNLQLAAFQGRQFKMDEKWDAEMNQKFQQELQVNRSRYRGQIAPDQTVNFLLAIPLSIWVYKTVINPDDERKFRITDYEEAQVWDLIRVKREIIDQK
jgi:hypothetical protein